MPEQQGHHGAAPHEHRPSPSRAGSRDRALAHVGERHARGEHVLGSLELACLSYYAALPGAAATLLLAGRGKEADH